MNEINTLYYNTTNDAFQNNIYHFQTGYSFDAIVEILNERGCNTVDLNWMRF